MCSSGMGTSRTTLWNSAQRRSCSAMTCNNKGNGRHVPMVVQKEGCPGLQVASTRQQRQRQQAARFQLRQDTNPRTSAPALQMERYQPQNTHFGAALTCP